MSHGAVMLGQNQPSALVPYARRFNGTSNFLTFGTGALGSGVGYGTMAVLFRKRNNAAWGSLCGMFQGFGGTIVVETEINDVNGVAPNWNNTGGFVSSPTFVIADGWAIVANKKPSGNFPSVAWKGTSAGVWTSGTSSPNMTDYAGAAGTVVYCGAEGGNADFLNGDLAIAAIWKNLVLTDAQIQTLWNSYATWTALAPTWMVAFNQATVSTVPDVTGGGGGQTAASGTTVVSDGPALPGYGL